MSKVNIEKYKKDVKEALKHSKELLDKCKNDSINIEELKEELKKISETYDELRDRPTSPELLEDFKRNRLPKHGAWIYELDSIKENISSINEFIKNVEQKKSEEQIEEQENLNDEERRLPLSLENQILNFENRLNRTKEVAEHLRNTLEGFVLDFSEIVEISETIQFLTGEYSELVGMLNDDIFPKINEYRSIIASGRIRGWTTKVDNLRRDILIIKNLHIDVYNSAVELVNNQIDYLNGLDNISDEDKNAISDLKKVDKVHFKVGNYDNVGYFGLLKHDVIIDILNRINVIKKNIENVKPIPPVPEPVPPVPEPAPDSNELYDILDADLTSLSKKIDDTSSLIDDYLNSDSVTNDVVFSLRGGIVENNASLFAKESNIHSIFNSKYLDVKQKDLLLEKVSKIKEQLVAVEDKLSVLEKKIDTYKNLSNKVMSFAQEIEDFNNFIAGMSDKKASEDHIAHLNEKIDEFEKKHAEISDSINSEFEASKINEDQKNNLNSLMNGVSDKIKISKDEVASLSKFGDKVIYRDDCGIDELENDLKELLGIINDKNSPIKRGDRKIINAKFRVCEENIKVIEKKLRYLKKYKPEKYNSPEIQDIVERLDKCNLNKESTNSIHNVRNQYRKKCPWYVKPIKKAVHFYKEHKKFCLFLAGLATFALVQMTVGPVIIPAIMHGNIHIGIHSRLLRPFVTSINNVLGKSIGAVFSGGQWQLANGVWISPAVGTTSLLKGIAISAGATALGVAPLIAGVKALVNKYKSSSLKSPKEMFGSIKNSKLGKKVGETGSRITKKVGETGSRITKKVGETGSKITKKVGETGSKITKKFGEAGANISGRSAIKKESKSFYENPDLLIEWYYMTEDSKKAEFLNIICEKNPKLFESLCKMLEKEEMKERYPELYEEIDKLKMERNGGRSR